MCLYYYLLIGHPSVLLLRHRSLNGKIWFPVTEYFFPFNFFPNTLPIRHCSVEDKEVIFNLEVRALIFTAKWHKITPLDSGWHCIHNASSHEILFQNFVLLFIHLCTLSSLTVFINPVKLHFFLLNRRPRACQLRTGPTVSHTVNGDFLTFPWHNLSPLLWELLNSSSTVPTMV